VSKPGLGEELSDLFLNGFGGGIAGFALSYLWFLRAGLRGPVEAGNVVFAAGTVLVLLYLSLTHFRAWSGPTRLAVAAGLMLGFFGEQQDWFNLTGFR